VGMGATLLSKVQAKGSPAPARRPNIIFICSDQHSGQMLMGGPGKAVQVRTPNLERLASMGVHFRNAYCASPVCVPARAALMTGRFPSDVASYGNATPYDGGVPTWGNYLHDAGYSCWATGKMDLTSDKDIGFQQIKTQHGHFVRPDITELFRRPLCYRIDERELVDGRVADRGESEKAKIDAALAFIKARASDSAKPWAAYVGIVLPHPPFEAPAGYWKLYPPDQMRLPNIPPGYLETLHPVFQVLRDFSLISTPIPEDRIRRARTAYYGMITELDGYVGSLLDELQRTGTLKDTVLVYTSDHGESLGEHGIWLKRNLLEGAARVPLIMAGSGLPSGRVIDVPVSHVDLTATILDISGVSRPAGLRGTSLAPLIHGDTNAGPPFVYAECHTEGNCTGSFMIRRGDWKHIYFSYYPERLLFNLAEDPGELNNLAGKPETASIQEEMHVLLKSAVDPNAVTARAFEKQEQILLRLVRDNKPDDFYQTLTGRLGPGQATALTLKYYPGWKPSM